MLDKYEEKLLSNWESVYQQGLLTFWVLIALADSELTVSELRDEISKLTNETYNTSEQVLYRSLRKYYDLELVDYSEIENPKGPKIKKYRISDVGKKVLKKFIKRNISLFDNHKIKTLNKEGN